MYKIIIVVFIRMLFVCIRIQTNSMLINTTMILSLSIGMDNMRKPLWSLGQEPWVGPRMHAGMGMTMSMSVCMSVWMRKQCIYVRVFYNHVYFHNYYAYVFWRLSCAYIYIYICMYVYNVHGNDLFCTTNANQMRAIWTTSRIHIIA